MAFFGHGAKPFGRLGIVLGHALAAGIEHRQIVLGLEMALFGRAPRPPGRFQVVLGQSATNSGIVLMPMMLGMVVAILLWYQGTLFTIHPWLSKARHG